MPSILVTGVSTGIGRACVDRFATEGWLVIGTLRRPGSGEDWPDGTVIESLDLAEPGSATELAKRVIAEHGCPDVLLNNAGTLQWGPVECATPSEVQQVFQVNVLGQLELIRGVLPAMRRRGSGVVANVTSLGGTMTFPFFGIYNASKWAMEGLSEGLWHELKPFGIKVKAIEPGYVATAIWDKAMRSATGEVIPGPEPYARYMAEMQKFEASITKRSSSAEAADEVFRAVTDQSDRLRYPIAAYAGQLRAARRLFGDQKEMEFFHQRWMGEESG
jgi:NAD(P)-dependent dehydrogenase (short-subunit alcohol dehydrogenase family)